MLPRSHSIQPGAPVIPQKNHEGASPGERPHHPSAATPTPVIKQINLTRAGGAILFLLPLGKDA
jgi:hypothetical protein